MEKVKQVWISERETKYKWIDIGSIQTCVKVFGEEGQTRIVNVHNTSDAKAIMAKVLHKFGIDECNADRYCIFVGSSTNGEGKKVYLWEEKDTNTNGICSTCTEG